MKMKLRAHQIAMDEVATKVILGSWGKRRIVLNCTPGGGKTASAILLANRLLDANIIDKVLWLVPRVNLAEQVVQDFAKWSSGSVGRVLTIAESESNLFADNLSAMEPRLAGHVTTYHQLTTMSGGRFAEAAKRRRVLVVFDEVQFLKGDSPQPMEYLPPVEKGGGWYERARSVEEAAALVLVMSGTLWRTDEEPIPFVEYENGVPKCDITYTLCDALAEEAVVPVEFEKMSGEAVWIKNGSTDSYDMASAQLDAEALKKNPDILNTFLSGWNAVKSVLDEMVDHWRRQQKIHPYGRMLVIAKGQDEAERYAGHLSDTHGITCVLATERTERKGVKLSAFRRRSAGVCLVTVQKAYIGFDCPDLTHLAFLSDIRAPSWMLQSFARVTRFDREAPMLYPQQRAYVFGPDDPCFRWFNEVLRKEQNLVVGMREKKRQQSPRDGGGGPYLEQSNFTPLDITISGKSVESMTRRLEPDIVKSVQAFAADLPGAQAVPISLMYEILLKTGYQFPRTKSQEPGNGAA